MPRVRCYSSRHDLHLNRVTRVDVPEDRVEEARYLFDHEQIYRWDRTDPVRILQDFPGHVAGQDFNHPPGYATSDPPYNSRGEQEERNFYGLRGTRDPVLGDIPPNPQTNPAPVPEAAEPRPPYPRPRAGWTPGGGLRLRDRPRTAEPVIADWNAVAGGLNEEGDPLERALDRIAEATAAHFEPEGTELPELDLNNINPEIAMSDLLPPFKIDYETIEEVTLRLRSTVILLKDKPFYVTNAQNTRAGFMLTVEDINGEKSKLPFSKLQNARSARPGYVTWKGLVCYLFRRPARINQQGMTQENTWLVPVGKPQNKGTSVATKELLELLGYRKPKRFNKRMVEDLLDHTTQGFRLSNSVAIYRKDDEKTVDRKIWVEYKGRALAPVKDHVVLLRDIDKTLPWITSDLAAVDIRVV